jgi:fermentation-respiration switch protein FrsA (DUF1100 family)
MPMIYLLLILLTAAVGVTYVVYRIGFYTPVRAQLEGLSHENRPDPDPTHLHVIEMMKQLDAIPFERVYVTSYDGLKLSGRLYYQKEGAPFLIGFHGFRGTPSWDFSGGSRMYLQLGYNILLIEERGHCESEGHTITYGIRERKDCLTWIRWVTDTYGGDTRILIAGISMGAATVLMASGLKLPVNVKGIIADCPYTTPLDIIRKVTETDMKIPYRIARPFILLAARMFGGFDVREGNAAEAVKHTPVPILLIHGEADGFVPCDMSRKIAASNPGMIEFHTFPGADHGMSYIADPARYEQIVSDFTCRVLNGTEEQ